MHAFTGELHDALATAATPERKAWTEGYMRNQFRYLGLDTTARRTIFKALVKAGKPSFKEIPGIVRTMWEMEREMHYCAIELAATYKKEWTPAFIKTIEYCLVRHSWWDTVDQMATDWTGPYFKLFPGQIRVVTGAWNQSDNFWLQRSSIMFQKAYRKQTDTDLLSKYILHCSGSGEFFIQKAIGWALREYAKTDPAWVKNFVQSHTLKSLSVREALKNIA